MFLNHCRARMNACFAVLVALSPFASALPAHADTVTLQPSADSTLIEAAPDNNLGGATFFNAGTAGTGNRNRALMLFDVAGQVPVGAIIQSITLSLEIVRAPAVELQATVFGLHRVNLSWGEGDKVPDAGPGFGAPATAGDVTWNQRFFGGPAWNAPGGEAGTDFAANASALTIVTSFGEPVFFESASGMVADVQSWLDNPDANFGWMLMSESEDVRRSARSFASREQGSGPLLTIEYVVVPEPGTTALMMTALGMFGWWEWRKSRKSRATPTVPN